MDDHCLYEEKMMENMSEDKLLAETEQEVVRLKAEIAHKESELNDLRLELGKAVIKLENHKRTEETN
jgi:hypothetical protein